MTTPEGDFGSDDGTWDAVDWGAATPLEIRSGLLRGRIGDLEADERQVPTLQGYASVGGGASVQLHASADAGALMTAIAIFPGLDHPSLAVGAELDGFGSNGTSWERGDLTIDVVGCSGPAEGQWDYDESATDVTVTVTDDDADDCAELTFTATFERTTTGHPETVVSRFEWGSTSQP